MNAPHLAWKSACGVIDEEDLAGPPKIYQRWGCSPTSSLGQMVEGLANGGVFVSGLMNSLPHGVDQDRTFFDEFCAFIDDVDPGCFRERQWKCDPDNAKKQKHNRKFAERLPQCVDKWPVLKSYEERMRDSDVFKSDVGREMVRRDRALLESAAVD